MRRMSASPSGEARALVSVKRTAAASPATGSAKAHALEEKTLIDLALGHDA
jgi:2-oxoglutarate dehydrogenase E1 component